MFHAFSLSPRLRALWDRAPGLPANGRRFGVLSGVFNLGLATLAMTMALADDAGMSPIQRYPIEATLRRAVKRPLVLLDAAGQPFARRGECVGAPARLADMPPHLANAAIAMEDRRFRSHFGVDPLGIARAMRRNYNAGGTREGGSTITQQLVKMSYLSSKRTMERKIEEALLAVWLEMRLGKDQILERYLNNAYFGEGCFGVAAAARHFFGKPVAELTVPESALLVALLRAPTQLIGNLGDANQRARLVMQSMVREGVLSPTALAEAAPVSLHAERASESASYYADWLADTLDRRMDDRHARAPLTVRTTLEQNLQKSAEAAIGRVLDRQGKRAGASQAALVAMRPDGRVVAIVGGRDYGASQFNRATSARRQPGSTFKTFVYLAVLQAGASPDMMVEDAPLDIGGWEPKNIGGRYRGDVSLRQAFASSINTVAVRLSESVGRERVIEVARALGVGSSLSANPSIALGTSEVTLMELTAAYAAVAAGAYPVKPWGAEAFEGDMPGGAGAPSDAGAWRLAKADDMRELLSAVVRRGSGRSAGVSTASFGKTGTSQDYRDAWFIGFSGNLVVGVWVGNDDFSAMNGVTGGSLPAEIWRRFMRDAIKTDPGFVRKPERIAAFAARGDGPLDRAASLGAVESVAVVGRSPSHVTLSGRGGAPRDFAGMGQWREQDAGFERLPRRMAPAPRDEQPAGRPSGAFRARLEDMDWPSIGN